MNHEHPCPACGEDLRLWDHTPDECVVPTQAVVSNSHEFPQFLHKDPNNSAAPHRRRDKFTRIVALLDLLADQAHNACTHAVASGTVPTQDVAQLQATTAKLWALIEVHKP